MIRKENQDKTKLQAKRKNEMLELSEVYRLQGINKYFMDAGSTERMLEMSDEIQNVLVRQYHSERALNQRKMQLEYKMTAE